MKYKFIETDEIIKTIDEHITADHLTVIASPRIFKVQQYPFSNILLTPKYKSKGLLDYIDEYLGSSLFLEKEIVNDLA